MYSLPQASLLEQELLEKRLTEQGYHQSQYLPELLMHEWRPIQFMLVEDDFGVKYMGEEHAKHLVEVLEKHYEISKD